MLVTAQEATQKKCPMWKCGREVMTRGDDQQKWRRGRQTSLDC